MDNFRILDQAQTEPECLAERFRRHERDAGLHTPASMQLCMTLHRSSCCIPGCLVCYFVFAAGFPLCAPRAPRGGRAGLPAPRSAVVYFLAFSCQVHVPFR